MPSVRHNRNRNPKCPSLDMTYRLSENELMTSLKYVRANRCSLHSLERHNLSCVPAIPGTIWVSKRETCGRIAASDANAFADVSI